MFESDAQPRRTAVQDFAGKSLSATDYFVLSRVDGASSVRTLGAMTGLGEAGVRDALLRLSAAGLVVDPSAPAPSTGPQRVASGGAAAAPSPQRDSGSSRPGPANGGAPTSTRDPGGISLELVPKGWPVPFHAFSFPTEGLEGGDALTGDQKKVVLYFEHHLRLVNYYDLFQVAQTADRPSLRRAYLRLSKSFHPDRWFRRDTGPFGPRIEAVFKWVNRAFAVLEDQRSRRAYDSLLSRGLLGEWQLEENKRKKGAQANEAPPSSQEPRDHAGRGSNDVMVIRARKAEQSGDFRSACDLYARAHQKSPSADLLLRAVRCRVDGGFELASVPADLREAQRLGASQVDCVVLEGALAARNSDRRGAETLFRRALELQPGHPDAAARLKSLQPG